MATDDARRTLDAHKRNERHRTYAETRYWCDQYRLLAEQVIDTPAPAAVPAVTDAMVEALRDIEMAACYGTEEDPDAGPSMLRTIGEIARKALAEIDSAQTESKSRTPPADPEVPR